MTKPKRAKASQFYRDARQIMQSKNTNIELAKQLLKKAINAGDPYAAYALGTWYFHGSNGLRKNKKRGVDLWTIAAKSKISDALFDLAVCYEKGIVFEKNLQQAFLLYMDAAIRGDKQAVFEVARCYTYGIGVPYDMQVAEIWSNRARELGTYESVSNGL